MTGRRRIIVVTIFVIMVGGLLQFYGATLQMAVRRPGPWHPIDAAWVARKRAKWPLAGNGRPIEISGVVGSVSYANVYHSGHTRAVTHKEIEMLAQAGMSVIRIDLDYDPWLFNDTQEIGKYDAAVSEIRRLGKKLMIADAAGESYRHRRKVSWSQYKQEWVERVRQIAARYKPDYYVVVKEPGWYWLMPSDFLYSQPFAKPEEWIELTRQLVAAVKQVSPQILTAVAVPGDSIYHGKARETILAYYTAVTRLPGLDIVGFDNYNAQSFDDTERFIAENGLHGKQLWLLEAWSHTGRMTPPGREPIDRDFVEAASGFAEHVNAGGVVFFFSKYLASYDPLPTTEPELLEFYSKRTSVFHAIQDVARRVGAKPGRQ
jgi:hypothetical protein